MTIPEIRPAVPADAPAVARLHADSWRRHYRGAFSDAYLDGDVVANRLQVWTARLAAPGHALTLIAEDGAGGLAGFVHTVFDEDPRWGSLVDNLHVTADRHRSGIGGALLRAAAASAAERAAPASGFHLWVLEQNTRAQAFYRAMGGAMVETAFAEAPGGDPGRLAGSPKKLRVVWPEPAAVGGD